MQQVNVLYVHYLINKHKFVRIVSLDNGKSLFSLGTIGNKRYPTQIFDSSLKHEFISSKLSQGYITTVDSDVNAFIYDIIKSGFCIKNHDLRINKKIEKVLVKIKLLEDVIIDKTFLSGLLPDLIHIREELFKIKSKIIEHSTFTSDDAKYLNKVYNFMKSKEVF